MRDDNFLAGDLYLPLGSALSSFPVILVQTPYNKNKYRCSYLNGWFYDPLFNNPNYAWVWVDWRGFYGSTAAAVSGYNRGFDGYDTVEWIAAQPWCSGSVGTWGASALGSQQFKTIVTMPPHLKASVPQVANIADSYEETYFGGTHQRLPSIVLNWLDCISLQVFTQRIEANLFKITFIRCRF